MTNDGQLSKVVRRSSVFIRTWGSIKVLPHISEIHKQRCL